MHVIFYSNDYYMGGIEGKSSFYFVSDSDIVYFEDEEEDKGMLSGTYYVDEEEEVAIEIDGKSLTLYIHTPVDLYDPETGDQFALVGTYETCGS